jgi:hypothetical protein
VTGVERPGRIDAAARPLAPISVHIQVKSRTCHVSNACEGQCTLFQYIVISLLHQTLFGDDFVEFQTESRGRRGDEAYSILGPLLAKQWAREEPALECH